MPPDPHAGGIGRYTYDLARGLHELGHRVTVITESPATIRHEALGFEVVGVQPGAPPSDLRQTPVLADNLGYAEAVARRYQELVEERGPFHVVHASNWGLDALGMAQDDTTPLVLMLVTPLERVIAAEGWNVSLDLASNLHLDQWLVERAARVCAPSSGVRRTYLSRTGWDGRSIHTVPLGIVPQPAQARHPGRRSRLLFVGRLERRKGIHVLLDVLPGLLERHPDWQCDLVGDSTLPAGLGVTFESLFCEEHRNAEWMERVTFHGTVSEDELQRYYRNADLFVAPSLYESFGLIYLEAMQHGVPVVACRVGGVPEVVPHEEGGLLVPADNAPALDHALERLISDEGLRRRLGTKAAELVRTRGTYLAFAERMVVEYREAVAHHAARHGLNIIADDLCPSVTDTALAVLDQATAPRGLGLAVRASVAVEGGSQAEADELVTAALGVSKHPEYFAMAVDLALTNGDRVRATELARRGFATTRDDSDACLLFAATLARTDSARAGEPTAPDGWDAWWRTHAGSWPTRLLGAALTSIRHGHDESAIVLLETCVAESDQDPGRRALASYHLGSAMKRRGDSAGARAYFERIHDDGLSLLPVPVRAGLHFHLGELNLREGQGDAAVVELESCLELNPTHALARTRLNEALRQTEAAA